MAVASDSPEITSAITALAGGHHDLGLTAIIGSNMFNIAGILGLAALFGREVAVGAHHLLANSIISLIVTILAMLLIVDVLAPPLALIALLLVLVPYALVISLRPATVQKWQLPAAIRKLLHALTSEADADEAQNQAPADGSPGEWVTVLLALGGVVLGAVQLVGAAVQLGERWQIPHVVIGTFVLAILTGLPNLIAGLQLAQRGHGAAVVVEAINSNSINLLTGVAAPALLISLPEPARHTVFAGWWLVGLTAVVALMALHSGRLGRVKAIILLLLYAAFAVWFIVL